MSERASEQTCVRARACVLSIACILCHAARFFSENSRMEDTMMPRDNPDDEGVDLTSMLGTLMLAATITLVIGYFIGRLTRKLHNRSKGTHCFALPPSDDAEHATARREVWRNVTRSTSSAVKHTTCARPAFRPGVLFSVAAGRKSARRIRRDDRTHERIL